MSPGGRRAEGVAEVFAALSHPRRIVILECLLDGEKSVGGLCACDRLAGSRQPNMSQHLAILRRAGLAKERRDGNRVYYSAASSRLKQLLRLGRQLSHEHVKGLLA